MINQFLLIIKKMDEDPVVPPTAGILLLDKIYAGPNPSKVYYKCITRNDTLLIPYKVKISFLKVKEPLYVLIKDGLIYETLGPVSSLEVYCKYQLYYYDLIRSPYAISYAFMHKWANKPIDKGPDLSYDIFIVTIDNDGTKDFDDGFCITDTHLHICVTKVDPDFHCFIERVETVYMPEYKYSMLNAGLEQKFSLTKDKIKEVIVLSVLLSDLSDRSFSIKKALIKNNYTYNNYKSTKILELLKVTNTRDAVAVMMRMFNTEAAKVIKDTIYRKDAQYTIEPCDYTHATSPIRRYVDYYNICRLANIIENSIDSLSFKFTVDIINKKSKDIKKVSSNTFLLSFFLNNNEEVYEGLIKDALTVIIKNQYIYYKNQLEIGSIHSFKLLYCANEYNVFKKIKLQKI
jgi:hypothetical protein